MRPDEHDLDEEIRGHIALSVRERIDRGEDPDAARIAAWREFGYVPQSAHPGVVQAFEQEALAERLIAGWDAF